MNRFFKGFICAALFCFCASHAQAASTEGKTASPQKQSSPAPAADAPSIQISEPSYDFGEIMEGNDVVHDFKVLNTGKTDLQIEQVRPG